MFPIAFQIGTFIVPTFYLMMVFASIGGTGTAYYFAKRAGLSRVAVIDLGIIGTTTGIIGARIFHIIIEYPWYYWENPSYTWQIWRGGLVWYGGMLFATISLIAYLRWKKLPILPYLDVIAVGCAVVLFFGRIGCFSVGCCYGIPTHGPLGIVFPATSEAGRHFPGIPLHPTQLYELTSMVIIWLVCMRIETHKRFHGETTWSFVILYAVFRSVIELFRGDADRGIFLGISTSQLISIATFATGLSLYLYCRKRYRL